MINFNFGVATITLGGTQLAITDDLLIDGPGADRLTISGNNAAARIFSIDDGDSDTIDVGIRGLTIADGGNGTAPIAGAGIENRENLFLSGVVVADNNAGTAAGGGLRTFAGRVDVVDSTLTGNQASQGGGIWIEGNDESTLAIRNTTISGNSTTDSGGGIVPAFGSTTIINSTITGNRADSDGTGGAVGGGLWSNPDRVTIHNSIVAGNFVGTGSTPADIGGGNVISGSSFNLIGDAGSAGGLTHGSDGNRLGQSGSGTIDITTVLNTTLEDNGGSVPTHDLVLGSPAIDAGSNSSVLDQLIQPIAALASTAGSDFRPAMNLVANRDLTLENYETTNDTAGFDNAWITDDPNGGTGNDYYANGTPDPVLMFDLGSMHSLTDVVAWGYQSGLNNDIKDFTIELSTNGGLTFGAPIPLTKPRYTFADAEQTMSLGGTFNANFVRMTITDNYFGEAGGSGGDRVAFNEIRFLGQLAMDARGFDRILDGDGNETTIVDIGAVEAPDRIALDDGTLRILGTDEIDIVRIQRAGAQFRVDANFGGVVEQEFFEIGDVTGFIVDALGGNDDVRLISVDPPATLLGGDGNDELRGSNGADSIVGGSGNDSILAGKSVDTVWGGEGNDTVISGPGDDFIIDMSGNNNLQGDDGNDTISTGAGDDSVRGGPGNDSVNAGEGANDVRTGGGNDVITTGSGADFISAGSQNDSVNSGSGNDEVRTGNGGDTVMAGDGNDTVVAGRGPDTVFGSTGDDSLIGNNGDDLLLGGSGNDTLQGSSDTDVLIGGVGSDDMRAGSSDDLLIGGMTTFDADMDALRGIQREWSSPRTYGARVANLRDGSGSASGFNGSDFLTANTTVNDESAADNLIGGSSQDWFFARLGSSAATDTLPDLAGDELTDELFA